jgi:hypothetical protein
VYRRYDWKVGCLNLLDKISDRLKESSASCWSGVCDELGDIRASAERFAPGASEKETSRMSICGRGIYCRTER